MSNMAVEPIQYLIFGHIAKDLIPKGYRLGGTVAYAGCTARALGCRVQAVTSIGIDVNPQPLEKLDLIIIPSKQTTTFENRSTPNGRSQILHAKADEVRLGDRLDQLRTPDIVHLGPIADEVDPKLMMVFQDKFRGLTPQGWFREWDESGTVRPKGLDRVAGSLGEADAVVLSLEDLNGDLHQAQEMASLCNVLVVTLAADGARVFAQGEERQFTAPSVKEVDSTGAGDVFAAAFFVKLFKTQDPWKAAYFANRLAAYSVTRAGLSGTPTQSEITAALEVLGS
jgi:sugar/nucleoside kinase (ribokinase family)